MARSNAPINSVEIWMGEYGWARIWIDGYERTKMRADGIEPTGYGRMKMRTDGIGQTGYALVGGEMAEHPGVMRVGWLRTGGDMSRRDMSW